MSDGGGEGKIGVISSAPPPTRHCTRPIPVKHLITIQDGGTESLIYLAFRSKITPALQARPTQDDRFLAVFSSYKTTARQQKTIFERSIGRPYLLSFSKKLYLGNCKNKEKKNRNNSSA